MDALLAVTELSQILQYVRDGGLLGVLLLIIVSGAKGWWVFGWLYREKSAEAEVWKEHVMRSVEQTEKATTIAEVIAKELGRTGDERREP